jgi:ribonuclease P protein component
VAPRAVDRNRMKRMARELFRAMPARPTGVDIVVQVRRCWPRDSSAAVRAELARMLEELAARARSN